MKNGFTLIETLFAVAIFAILGVGIAALAYLYAIYAERLPEERLRTEVLRRHQTALEDMKRGIREAGEIVASTTIDSQLYETGSTVLVLRNRTIDADGNVLANRYDRIVYALVGTSSPYILHKIVEPSEGSAAKLIRAGLNDSVKELAFTYNHSSSSLATAVQIYLITEKSRGSDTHTATSTIDATLH